MPAEAGSDAAAPAAEPEATQPGPALPGAADEAVAVEMPAHAVAAQAG